MRIPQASQVMATHHRPRQVFSGHYVPAGTPTPHSSAEIVPHSRTRFPRAGPERNAAGPRDGPVTSDCFPATSAGRRGRLRDPFGGRPRYALSIYGTEYNQAAARCGTSATATWRWGRAISVFEGRLRGQALGPKGGAPRPYCRGADGTARACAPALREFLAQEFMHRPWGPTSRSADCW